MSQDQINTLNQQLQQQKQNLDACMAQLEASKQMLNEAHNTSLIIRSNFLLAQKQMQELHQKNAELMKQIQSLNQQLTDATAKIATLEPKESLHAVNS